MVLLTATPWYEARKLSAARVVEMELRDGTEGYGPGLQQADVVGNGLGRIRVRRLSEEETGVGGVLPRDHHVESGADQQTGERNRHHEFPVPARRCANRVQAEESFHTLRALVEVVIDGLGGPVGGYGRDVERAVAVAVGLSRGSIHRGARGLPDRDAWDPGGVVARIRIDDHHAVEAVATVRRGEGEPAELVGRGEPRRDREYAPTGKRLEGRLVGIEDDRPDRDWTRDAVQLLGRVGDERVPEGRHRQQVLEEGVRVGGEIDRRAGPVGEKGELGTDGKCSSVALQGHDSNLRRRDRSLRGCLAENVAQIPGVDAIGRIRLEQSGPVVTGVLAVGVQGGEYGDADRSGDLVAGEQSSVAPAPDQGNDEPYEQARDEPDYSGEGNGALRRSLEERGALKELGSLRRRLRDVRRLSRRDLGVDVVDLEGDLLLLGAE